MSNQSINRFLNYQGQLKQWPTKRSHKDLALAYLASKFSSGTMYTEREVNDLLKQWHTFSDWPLLRRELYECGYLARERDGSKYWLTNQLEERTE